MSVNLPLFLLALALLWLPRPWLRRGATFWRGRRRHAVAHSWTHAPADGTTLSFRHEFTKTRNYLDLFRAAIGAMALVGSNGFTAALTAAPGSSAAIQHQVLFVRIGVLLAGMLIQCVRWDHGRLALSAPIFYLAGMTMGLQGPMPGACAFAIAWAVVPVVPFAPGFLTLHALVFGAIGTFLGGVNVITLAGVGICLVPVLLSLLTRRPLLIYSRRPASTRAVSVS